MLAWSGDRLMIVKAAHYHFTPDQPIAWLVQARKRDGKPTRIWPFDLPADATQQLRAQSWPQVHGDLQRESTSGKPVLTRVGEPSSVGGVGRVVGAAVHSPREDSTGGSRPFGAS